MLEVRSKYAPGSCQHDDRWQEVRWDLQGCNLRCSFCWSPASRPAERREPSCRLSPRSVAERTVAAISDKGCAFIRFTGGEPTLQWLDLAASLTALRQALTHPRPPILIQTNGVEIGRANVDLSVLDGGDGQQFLLEVSFKGTNPSEFGLLTGQPHVT